MRLPASEKLEIIGLVEQSRLPAELCRCSGSSHRHSIARMTGSDLEGLKPSKTRRRSPIARAPRYRSERLGKRDASNTRRTIVHFSSSRW